MSGLLDAIPFLKGAVGRSLPGGQPSTYTVNDGVIYAQSPSILAAYPVSHMLGTFCLAAEDIEKALGRMLDEPKVIAGDGTIILNAGRLRSTIELLPCEPPDALLPTDVDWDPPPPTLIDAMRVALPFIPKDATWNRSLLIDNDRVVALSNRSSIEVSIEGLGTRVVATLSDDCVEYLCGLKEPPSGWLQANNSILFTWPSGAWARCQKTALPWPAPYDSHAFFDKFEGDVSGTGVSITDEWREAFADVASLGDGTVTVLPNGVLGRSAYAKHEAEFETGVKRQTVWAIKSLKPVIDTAALWYPDQESGPSFFSANGIRGVVVGQRR